MFAAHTSMCLRPAKSGDPGQPLLPYVSLSRINQHFETIFFRSSVIPKISAFQFTFGLVSFKVSQKSWGKKAYRGSSTSQKGLDENREQGNKKED